MLEAPVERSSAHALQCIIWSHMHSPSRPGLAFPALLGCRMPRACIGGAQCQLHSMLEAYSGRLSGCPIVALLSRAACRIEARAKPVPAAQLSHHAACQQHPTHEHGREIHSAPDAFRARYVAHRHRRCSGSQLVIGEPLAESEENTNADWAATCTHWGESRPCLHLAGQDG